jgi:mRNA interferase RelE/StbE
MHFDIKKLQDREGYRLRVGDYRVIYRLYNKELILELLEVGHRKNIYSVGEI